MNRKNFISNYSDKAFKKHSNRLIIFILSLMLASLTLFENVGFASGNQIPSSSSNIVSAQTVSISSSNDLQREGIIRPEELEEGLSRKSFEDMEGRRVTLRQPYMEVTDRDVKRTEASTLDDTFRFIDPNTGDLYTGDAQEIAKIDFNKDGKEGNQIGEINSPRYPMRGLANSKSNDPKIFSDFEKYMLLRQAWYYRKAINDRMESGNLSSYLKKHPAADGIYGKVDETASAVSKTIISDPIYDSPLTTGLYLVPGEVVRVVISDLKDGQTVKLTTHQQDSLGYDGGFPQGFNPATYFNEEQYKKYQKLNSTEKYFMYWDSELIKEAERAHSAGEKPNYTKFSFSLQGQWQWQNQKVPCMGSIFEFTHNGTYEIGSIYGGPLYLQPTSSVVKLEISGAVETPHFILGVTTKDEFDQHLKDAPGLIATLDVENGQLIGLAEYMKKSDDIEKLAYFWHSVFAINSSLNGRQYNYNITMAYDIHVPAGEAVALNSSFAAQPYGWFEACMNYETLTTKGNWGTFHELGHIQAKTYGVNWGMCGSNCKNPCEGEVWNNTLIILTYSMLCNMDTRVIGVEHGEFVHPFSSVRTSMNLPAVSDYHDYNNTNMAHFAQLSLYSTLIHSFGPEKFIDFFYTYKVNPSYCNNARADFIYRIGLVDHVNILEWINENYHGNVNEKTDFSTEQLQYLNTLPPFYPIAYEWANGIDSNETARKYDVDGKNKTIFDLSPASFASYKPFSIVDVTKPTHGSINYNSTEQKAIYTPPMQATEYDEFDIIVSTEGGRIVTLNVRLHLVYNGAYIEVFKLDPTDTTPIKNLVETQKGKEPFRTEESVIAGKAKFRSNDKEYFHIKFSFKATTTGLHKFGICGDDGIIAFFRKGGEFIENGSGGVLYSNGKSGYANSADGDNHFARANLQVGDIVDIDCHLVNRGGDGFMKVGVILPGTDKTIDIPAENIVNTSATSKDLADAENFDGWQPKFLDSIKDESIDYVEENVGWQVVEFPEYQADDGNNENSLVDGNNNTYFHTRWRSNPPKLPHKFVIDCKENISINYFDVVRRGNVNDKLYRVALYGAPDSHDGVPDDNSYEILFEGPIEKPDSGTYRLTFEEHNVRYLKFVVEENSGHTVIRELTAGRAVDLGQTVKPRNFENAQDGFEENKSNGKLSTRQRNAYYEFNFLGSGFDIFADTNPDYGTAEVYLDSKKIGEIDLADKIIFNKCVFREKDLDIKEHTVRIVAKTEKYFNISFINVNYGTPVDKEDYPVASDDYGEETTSLTFSTEWRTLVKNYKTVTRIDFKKSAPQGYVDTFIRMNKYIHIYNDPAEPSRIAFVYPGDILAPSDSSFLFAACSSLREINFENFNTKNMLFATSMFNSCLLLESLNLSGFNTDKVLFLSTLFENCVSLKDLNLSGFHIREAAQVTNILKGCRNLTSLFMPSIIESDFVLPFHFLDQHTNHRSTVASAENAGHELYIHEVHNDLLHFDYLAPTRDKDGHIEYDKCVCGAYLVNGEEVSAENIVVSATGYLDIIFPCVGVAVLFTTIFVIWIIVRSKKSKKKLIS